MQNTQPNLNPSPKTRFRNSGPILSAHREMVSSSQFEMSTDFAMLHYNALCAAQIRDGNSAMAAGLKMQGAQEYLQELKMLSELPQVSSARIADNLDPRH